MKVEEIARVCHEAGRGMTHILQDVPVQKPFDEISPDMRASLVKGVQLIIDHPETTAEESHAAWCKDRYEHGWIFGEKKSDEAKTHPALRPWADLPEGGKQKDAVFRAIVQALR